MWARDGKTAGRQDGTCSASMPPCRLAVLPSGWGRVRGAILRLLGMPDYEAYVAHLRTRHPERQVPSEREFFEQYLRYRYESGATRCC